LLFKEPPAVFTNMALPGSSQNPGSGALTRLGERLAATRQALARGLSGLLGTGSAPNPDRLKDLESALLQADVGVAATGRILEAMGKHAGEPALRTALLDVIAPCERPLEIPAGAKPFVILVVGVNGAGKTTTIGKLAHRLQRDGRKVMLAAADTFRAAAVEQLKVWGERNDVPVIAQAAGADAAAVTHDAMHAAVARGMDVLIVDTAGRLHTQGGLMDELKKIRRIIERIDPQAPHETLLVLDAGIGQNALAQREHFQAAAGVTGLILTKLDGTAKGGVLFAMAAKNPLPIRFIGVGEGIDDLRPFQAAEFVDALLPGNPA
jgi:fused signal recognition particle receptor